MTTENEGEQTIFDIPIVEIIVRLGRAGLNLSDSVEQRHPEKIIILRNEIVEKYMSIINLRRKEFYEVSRIVLPDQTDAWYYENATGICMAIVQTIDNKKKETYQDN